MDFRVGAVVYHAKAVFGPGVVLRVYDDPEAGPLLTVLWQSTGQRLEHTPKSLSATPVSLAGGV